MSMGVRVSTWPFTRSVRLSSRSSHTMFLITVPRHRAASSWSSRRSMVKGSFRRSISSAHLTIERQTDKTRFENRPPNQELVFGTTMSDHMLLAEWNQDTQWSHPRIVPYQDLKLSPTSSCLHYGKCQRI